MAKLDYRFWLFIIVLGWWIFKDFPPKGTFKAAVAETKSASIIKTVNINNLEEKDNWMPSWQCSGGVPARLELSSYGHRGCCSWHGGMKVKGKFLDGLYAACCTKKGEVLCNDGTASSSCTCSAEYPFSTPSP